MAGWHHRINRREFEWTLGVGDAIHGVAKSQTWLSDWPELKSIKCKYVKQNPRITEKNGQINFQSEWLYISRQNIGGDIKNLEYLYLLPMKNIK